MWCYFSNLLPTKLCHEIPPHLSWLCMSMTQRYGRPHSRIYCIKVDMLFFFLLVWPNPDRIGCVCLVLCSPVDDPKCEGQAPVQSAQKSQIYVSFIADVKKSIGLEKSNQLFSAIQSYKKTDNYDSLVGTVVSLLTEKNEDFNLLSSKFLPIRVERLGKHSSLHSHLNLKFN